MNQDQLTIRDLRIDQQLEDISKRATPSREAPSEPPSYLSNTVVSDINLRDLGIEEQLQKISRNTIKDVWGWKPTPIKSDVTNEMIQEYQDELERSYYEDPITGRKLKYVPVNTDFTLEEPDLQEIPDIKIGYRILSGLVKRLQLIDDAILKNIKFIEDMKKDPEFVRERRQLVMGTDFIETVFDKELRRREINIDNLKDDYADVEARIKATQQAIQDVKEKELYNQAEIDRVRKANRELLKQKSDQLNLLNRGKLDLQQQPNESDEDFKQRLLDVGQVEFDEKYITDAAERRTKNRFKENMKGITRNNMLIETMIKLVPATRLFEYNKFFSLILKKFEEIYGKATLTEKNAQELIEFFDNVLAKEQYYLPRETPPSPEFNPEFDVAVNAYRELTKQTAAAEKAAERGAFSTASLLDDDLQARAVSDFGLAPLSPLPPIATFPALYRPASELRQAEAVAPAEAVASAESVPFNPYKMTKDQLIKEFSREYNADAPRGKLLTSSLESGGHANKGDIIRRLLDRGLIQSEDTYTLQEASARASSQSTLSSYFPRSVLTAAQAAEAAEEPAAPPQPAMYSYFPKSKNSMMSYFGRGVYEDIPKFAYFGKIAINPKALYYDNNLIVMKHNKHHINGYNMVKVSDHFVNAIMKILNQEKPKNEDLKHFDLNEKELYDMVIHLAGLHKRVDHNLDRTKQAMKHRFNLLDGEVNAGNNNHVIKKELKDLVHKMAFAGMISHHEAQLYLYPNIREKYHKKRASKSKK